MRILCVVAVVLILATPVLADEGSEVRTFVLHYSVGEAWLPDRPFSEQPGASEHGRNLRSMRDAGFVIMGGRYADKGMLIVQGTEAELRGEIEKDPMVKSGAFRYLLEELSIFFEGCVERVPSGS